ncbi:MAG: hypothetical protein AAB434_07005 [Planctomycetota bacterium]
MKATRWVSSLACAGLLVTAAARGPEMGPRDHGARSGTARAGRGTVVVAEDAGRGAVDQRLRSGSVLPEPLPCQGWTDACGPAADEWVRGIQERLLADLVTSARLTGAQRDLARGVLQRLDRREQELLGEMDIDSLTEREAERINGRLDELAQNARRDLERLLLPDQVGVFEEWCGRTGLTQPASLAVLDEAKGE